MKQLHTLSLVLSLAITLTVTAQVNKGAIFLGGNIGFSHYKIDYGSSNGDTKTNSILLAPAFGVAIKNNLVAGVTAQFGSSTTKESNTPNSAESRSNSYGAGFFLRKYKAIGKSGFSIFAQGNLGGGYTKSENENQPIGYRQEIRTTNVGLSVAPGISYAISRKLQLETGFNNALSLNFSNQKASNYNNNTLTTSQKTNGFDISTSLNSFTSSFYLGFRVLLNKS